MIRFLIVTMLLFLNVAAWSQGKATLNGYLKDGANGEVLIGVSVYIPQLKAGTTTNPYGFYSITVPPGTYDVVYSFIGYNTQTVSIALTGDVSRSIEMGAESTMMQEVEISGERVDANVVGIQMSKNTLNLGQVRKLPALFGEVDILKSVQMLPGVISAGEGTSAFFVRGGGGDQNLILMDEAPIYDASHLGGLVSVFNADVIKDSELYKGGIPARFGGRLSSILEVRTIDGNNKNFQVQGGLGTLASRLSVQGPIKQDKASFLLSGRVSNIGAYLKAADVDNGVTFYDLNGKINLKVNDKNRFFISGYLGRDKITFDDGDAGFGWGNATATFRWNHLFNERLFSNTSLIASRFDYSLEINDPAQGFKWTSDLTEVSLKNDLSYFINTNNELTFGYHLTSRRFQPARIVPSSEGSLFKRTEFEKMYALDHALFISNEQRINDQISLEYGVRLSIFQNVGPGKVYWYEDPQAADNPVRSDSSEYNRWETIKAYINLEPRLGVRYALGEDKSIKASYNRMVQNTHQMAAGTVPLPFNNWAPSGPYLKPQVADQVALGYFQNFKDNMYEGSVEVYYKDVNNVTDFADNAEILLNEDLSTEYRQGDSWAYGAEFMINKKKGKLTGMATYTWSKVMRKIDGVNQQRDADGNVYGKTYAAGYDRRNVANIIAAYDYNDKWTFGASFTYSTGRPITLPSGKYELDGYMPNTISERNGYRMPDFHHLDLSVTLNPRKNATRRFKGQWVFSVYNVYSRKNAFTIYTRTKRDDDNHVIGDGTQKEARMIYLFPVLPSVTYNIKF
ncbi:TonB-dependent receptor [Dawidia soli]|uniref:Carboxypeptidase-like regulatory domain-containing protein n=1 Tax=Dawidia soli TaxID=2782352 RepID=A0AAP2D6V1_9BACT|nr:TonB-dependent receptor [Dawidia soli]MBT1685110.1 carboxypeptidase-like regulatory domain-containing protein [Dawidia soli]